MLANDESVKGVDFPTVFSQMIEELPWASLRSYIQANSQLLKLCTLGGHRLEPRGRKRVHGLLANEAAKNEFSQAFCNGLFACWYPVHEALHKTLEEFFHSDEYKAYRKEHDLADDDYVLPDEKFEEVFAVDDLMAWRILLCFSPLKFSDVQTAKLLNASHGSTDLLRRLAETEQRLAAAEKEKARFETENERFRQQAKQSNAETQECRRAQRESRAEIDTLTKKLEALQGENKRLREQSDSATAALAKIEKAQKTLVHEATMRLETDVKRAQEQLASWQSKYEEQRVENRQLETRLENLAQRLAEQERHAADVMSANRKMQSFADLILGRLDWPKVGGQMKLTPALSRQFNSLIKKLDYEEDLTLTIEECLPEFWSALMAVEKDLIDKIAESNAREVMDGDVEAYWRNLTDQFEDVRIGLEARTVLIKMLHEIFYQVLEMEDLQKAAVAVGATTRKHK